jgi:hypothetical protein
MRLTLKLPITVDSQELTEVMTGIVDRINSSIILPMDRRATTANQQTMEEIQWLKVEQMKQKSRLNKLYYSLWKVSDADRLGAVSPVALNSNGQSEAISLDQVLALIGKLTTENLIDAKQETKYYQELVDIQTKLEELPRQINKRSSMLSQFLLKPIALDLSRKHGVVVSNAETLPSKAETSQTQVQGTTPAPPIPPIRSPGFFVILGLMFGLFSGLTVAAIKFFLEKNWDLIKARVNA